MSKKKVLVIGGTGIAGQFITDYLLHYHDICELFIASRGIHKISEKKVKFIKMDIHDTQNRCCSFAEAGASLTAI